MHGMEVWYGGMEGGRIHEPISTLSQHLAQTSNGNHTIPRNCALQSNVSEIPVGTCA